MQLLMENDRDPLTSSTRFTCEKKSLSLIIDILSLDEKMVLGKLREKLGHTIYYKPLIKLGKIVVALAAIIYVLGGLVEVIQASISLSNGGKPVASFLWIILWGSLKITLGYGYYTLLDMRKDGLIASIAEFFAQLSAGIIMIYSLLAIFMGY